MPLVALGLGRSLVACGDGIIGTPCAFSPLGNPIAWLWNTPSIWRSLQCSTNVFANGTGVVRLGDIMVAHPAGEPCTPAPIPHTPFLSKGSATVFVNSRPLGRVGDVYNGGTIYPHVITTGSLNVFAGG